MQTLAASASLAPPLPPQANKQSHQILSSLGFRRFSGRWWSSFQPPVRRLWVACGLPPRRSVAALGRSAGASAKQVAGKLANSNLNRITGRRFGRHRRLVPEDVKLGAPRESIKIFPPLRATFAPTGLVVACRAARTATAAATTTTTITTTATCAGLSLGPRCLAYDEFTYLVGRPLFVLVVVVVVVLPPLGDTYSGQSVSCNHPRGCNSIGPLDLGRLSLFALPPPTWAPISAATATSRTPRTGIILGAKADELICEQSFRLVLL